MNKKKCPLCGAVKTKKNGTRKGVQLYKCLVCRHQFRSGVPLPQTEMWTAYQNGKQTIRQLSEQTHLSTSSIKRRLCKIECVWTQPDLTGQTGYVHLDVTYWGHNWGVMLALDDTTNKPLYVAFVKSETTQDYRTAYRHYYSSRLHDKRYHYRRQKGSVQGSQRLSDTDVPIPYVTDS